MLDSVDRKSAKCYCASVSQRVLKFYTNNLLHLKLKLNA